MATVAVGSLPSSLAVYTAPLATAALELQVATSPAARSTGSAAALAGAPA